MTPDTITTATLHGTASDTTPRFYVYLPERDYYLGPRHTGWKLPTDTLPVTGPASADFFLLPEDLRRLQIDLGIVAVRRFAEALPYYRQYPERHIFCSSHDDHRSPLPEAIFCKTSVNRNEPGRFIAVPYQIEDDRGRSHFDFDRIHWQTCFFGYPGSSPLRERLLLAIAASKNLSSHLDIAPKFHWHLEPHAQNERRESYLNALANSLTVLCPRGEGMNSIRFYEALSMGRIPVLLADNGVLPFENLIHYERFVIRIAEQNCDRADLIIASWIKEKSPEELMLRCREAQQVWQQLLAPGSIIDSLQCMLALQYKTTDSVASSSLSNQQQGLDAYLTGDLTTAETYFQKAVATNPDDPEAIRCLALLLNEAGRPREAIELLVNARTKATFPHLNRLLGEAYQQTGQWFSACQQFCSALIEEPHHALLLMNTGIVCSRLNRLDDALFFLRSAAASEPASAHIHMNLGCILQSLNRIEEATGALREAVRLEPNHGTTRWNLAQLLLLQGHFEEGLELFEARFTKRDPVPRLNIPAPLWQGEPLAGKTIIISTEQAFGDAIQFVRYLPMLARQGARVILSNHLKPLQQLFQSVPGILSVVNEPQQLPSADYHLPMLSLPRLFGTRLENIPSSMIPYLAPNAEKLAQWLQRLTPASGMKIGLCWAGRQEPDPRRSARLEDFSSLTEIQEAVFYSLQLGDGAVQTAIPPAGMRLIDLTGDIQDFEDTAALMAQLDLIITIDTSVAHLAGALGKPVFTLLPVAPDWRWLLERTDCPWYPTMLLFRQVKAGDWSEPVRQVCSFLKTHTISTSN